MPSYVIAFVIWVILMALIVIVGRKRKDKGGPSSVGGYVDSGIGGGNFDGGGDCGGGD